MEDNNKIDISRCAFVAIDLQKGIAGRQLYPNDSKIVISNAAALAEEFRRRNAFVVLVNVSHKDGKDALKPIADQQNQWGSMQMPKDWSDLVDELHKDPSDLLITKRQWGAFYGTELDLQLRRRGIDTIVLCGISTNIGVETTAREAYQHGYNIVIAKDACSAISNEEHEHSLKYIFQRISRIRDTKEIISMLK